VSLLTDRTDRAAVQVLEQQGKGDSERAAAEVIAFQHFAVKAHARH
jgi:hypothetical protein